MVGPFLVIECRDRHHIQAAIQRTFETFSHVLPASRESLILLKPNLNSHMNALTGNTTDLRILAEVIIELKRRDYRTIVIGEGSNSGFYRNNISVINRLRVDALAKAFAVEVIDLNYTEGKEIELDHGLTAEASKICSEADLFINLPKIKTHFEVGITVCLKSLIGCMVGQKNKKKIHTNLPRNIININRAIKPHLQIIDGLIAMEGTGPTRGTPVNLGKIIVGENPYVLDYLSARIMGIPYTSIDYLKIAINENLLSAADREELDQLTLDDVPPPFKQARANLLVRLIFDHRVQRYFQKLRATRLADWICSSELGGTLLFKSGIRQDVFVPEKMEINRLVHDPDRCQHCGRCAHYCPLGRNLPEGFSNEDETCLQCLYCFSVCPNNAISVEGDLGFFSEQVRQFGEVIKKIL